MRWKTHLSPREGTASVDVSFPRWETIDLSINDSVVHKWYISLTCMPCNWASTPSDPSLSFCTPCTVRGLGFCKLHFGFASWLFVIVFKQGGTECSCKAGGGKGGFSFLFWLLLVTTFLSHGALTADAVPSSFWLLPPLPG